MGSDIGYGVPESVCSLEDSRTGRWRMKKKGGILLEGYVGAGEEMQQEEEDEGSGSDRCKEDGFKGFSRTMSLTDVDLDELKGCVDLGFGFTYEEIPELCNTLPALELCYSMSQRFMDEQQQRSPSSSLPSSPSEGGYPIANWKISSPGDHPEDVKARLKFWAQAVACTVKLCS